MKGSKPITWYATPQDRHFVSQIALSEESRDSRPCGATHVITIAVRAFSQLYKIDPAHALAQARDAMQGNGGGVK